MENISRRNLLKTFGLTAGGLSLFNIDSLAETADNQEIVIPNDERYISLDKPVTAIVLGAGNRGNVYGRFALAFPNELDMVGVAEPIPFRNDRFAKSHNIEEKNRFKTWEDVFKVPKFADAIIISTPDWLHYGPAMKALEMGYDVLLEKPISPSMQECLEILAMAKKTKRIIAVCHVLRYTPYFKKLKEIAGSGQFGKLISVNHLEGIEYAHMAHSYVRGNWHVAKDTNPIILAKSCHDLDILRWIIGKPCKSISAYGSLTWFKRENAPEGSTDRCTDGCKVEAECPFSAIRIYQKEKQRINVLDVTDDLTKQSDEIYEKLKTSQYGRCVYRMDNDQPDHYTTSMEFEGGTTVSFAMEAFTSFEHRKTRLMFSQGEVWGDMNQIQTYDFRTKETTSWKANEQPEYKNQASGHGGGDYGLARNFVQAVAQNKPELLTSTIEASIESHIMGFMAEKSRLNKQMVEVKI
ncbi:Inositol 2-dehydrogenase/D-chiro-inositol 3-dehydrogenase [Emticicia aquatica]|uniref:Inositol 2-dehydrogenase/D-chiro-inositol 3-dehydrogenase n=1 Tax=Emticicia aquatica TaxID=1681835 RepID=A0ABM9AU04_9BACT|nr:Gfo/Idh/MocA family oxidoreductase [Emticicia aquatica]CAH0997511.1 Inositol 2-dehydrogenase/D-chiro-inositol 3-dehydrogenase [Emticicia aquatica]